MKEDFIECALPNDAWKWDRYIRTIKGEWRMIHIGCFDSASQETRELLATDALREPNGSIEAFSASRANYPDVPCFVCGKRGKLN